MGDFTLFWTGVFPEGVGRLAAVSGGDALLDWKEEGKRAYYLASVEGAGEVEAPVFRRLSAEFELCAFGLSRVRKEWESLPALQAGAGGFGGIVV